MEIPQKRNKKFFSGISISVMGFVLLIGMVAGLLPATVISALRPVQILSGISKIRVFSRVTLRKILIVFQFALSMILIIIVTLS